MFYYLYLVEKNVKKMSQINDFAHHCSKCEMFSQAFNLKVFTVYEFDE